MNPDSIDWDEDLPPASPEEEYQALRRAIQRTDGFGLLFVQCAPAKGHEIIEQIILDLPQKKVEVLSLKEPIRNLYERVEALPNRDEIDVLFIEGLEYSIYEYEDAKRHLGWTTEEIQSYSWKGVPHVLTNLNQQRERFRDNFQICYVFLVPLFVLKYLIHRAPDFFDWRSSLFKFFIEQQVFFRESALALNCEWGDCFLMTSDQKRSEVSKIEILIDESVDYPSKMNLFIKEGQLLNSLGKYKEAIFISQKALEINHDSADAWDNIALASMHLGQYEQSISACDKAIKIEPHHYWAWHDKGLSLSSLGKLEEAVLSYRKAISIKQDHYWGWDDLGNALAGLGRYPEALSSHEKAIEINPNYYWAWLNRGATLAEMNHFEEAIKSYQNAIDIKPDFEKAWNNRGAALGNLGRYDEAIASYDKALEIKPDYFSAWNNRSNVLLNLGRYEETIASYDQAVQIKPDKHEAWFNRGLVLFNLRRYEEAIASYDQAVQIKPDKHEAWFNRGLVLFNLRRYEEAIASYEQALEIKPDKHEAWFNRGIALGNLGRDEDAIASYEKAIEICSNNSDQKNKANYLIALSRVYSNSGQVLKGIAVANQANQILTELGAPLEEMPYPNWLKRTIQFSGKSKLHNVLVILGVIVLAPAYIVFLCILIPWRILRFQLLKKGSFSSKP